MAPRSKGTVELLKKTPLHNAATAARLCIGKEWEPGDAEGVCEYLKKLIDRGHESVLEHVVYTFRISGISRACLQQLSRHRHTSPSVKSTRWALQSHADFYAPIEMDADDYSEYCDRIQGQIEYAKTLAAKYGNDVGKYALPECLLTDEILTLNLRELRHIYRLRSAPNAMREFRDLIHEMTDTLGLEAAKLVMYIPKKDRGYLAVQHRIDIDGENEMECAVVRQRDGVVIGKVSREYAEEILPYFGQAASVKLEGPTEEESDENKGNARMEGAFRCSVSVESIDKQEGTVTLKLPDGFGTMRFGGVVE